jgi:hypothetical protein
MLRKLMPLAFAAGLAGSAAAQSTGTPVFRAPYRAFPRTEWGVSLSDAVNGAGSLAVEGFYGFAARASAWDLGLRAGIADLDFDTAVLFGVDARLRVIDQTEEFPLDGAFTLGVGAGFVSGSSWLNIPIGLSLGRRLPLEGEATALTLYGHPVLMPTFSEGDSELGIALGLGGDLRLGRRFEIRLNIGIGDIETFSIGFAVLR